MYNFTVRLHLFILASCVLLIAPALSAQAQEAASQSTNPITLAQALQLAEARSPSMLAAKAQIDAALGNQSQAAFRLNPEVSLEVENFAGNDEFSGIGAAETTLRVGQRFELGDKRGARTRVAKQSTTVAQIEAQIARSTLAAQVRSRFADAVHSRAQLQIAHQVLERNKAFTRIAGEFVSAGREPPLHALRAEAALSEASAALKSAEAQDSTTRRSLASLWGERVPPDRVASLWLGDLPVPEITDPQHIYSVQLAEAQSLASQAVLERERAYATPDITLSGGLRRFEQSSSASFVVGASMQIPLFDRNQGAIAAAKASVDNSRAQQSLELINARLAIQTALASLESARSQVDTLQKQTLPQTEEALRLANLGYRYGRTGLFEVLSAAESRDRTLSRLNDTRRAAAEAMISLLELAGE